MDKKSRDILERIATQLSLPFPENAQEMQNLSKKILELEVKRLHAQEVHVTSKEDEHEEYIGYRCQSLSVGEHR